MFRALLVDNEKAIRQGIRDNIDWNSFGIEIAGEAGDGQTALKMVDELSPHILITDIKMPYMDGLKLSELVKLSHPDMKIVLISGYDDFKYAQKGISIGVDGYILKPVDRTELEELLGRLTSELESVDSGEVEKNGALAINSLLLEKFLRGIIYGKQNRAEILQKKKKLIGEEDYCFVCMLVQLDNYMPAIRDMTDEEQSAYLREFYETIELYTAGVSGLTGFASVDYTYVLIMYDMSAGVIKERISRVCPQLKQVLLNSDMSVSVGIGQTVQNIMGIRTSYDEARIALKYKFITGENSTVFYSNIENLDESSDILQKKLSDDVITALELSDREMVKNVLNKARVELIAGGNRSQTYMGLFIGIVFRRAVNYLESIGVSIDEIFEKPMEEYSGIVHAETLLQAIDMLNRFLVKVIDFVEFKKQGRLSKTIESAKKYIEEHYTDRDINLTKIAGHIQMSVSYFSYEFKQFVGKTYVEFLTELRINKAKQLLRSTSFKVSEISSIIGYDNSTYFNYLFKQYTGMTPGQYRKEKV